MATKTKDFLTKAAVKQDDGTLGSYTPIGASFEDFIPLLNSLTII